MSGMHLTASGTATRRLAGTGREAGGGAGGWSRDRYERVRSRSTSGGGVTRPEGGSGSELRCSCKDASTVYRRQTKGEADAWRAAVPLTLRTSMQLTPSAGIGKGTIPFPSIVVYCSLSPAQLQESTSQRLMRRIIVARFQSCTARRFFPMTADVMRLSKCLGTRISDGCRVDRMDLGRLGQRCAQF